MRQAVEIRLPECRWEYNEHQQASQTSNDTEIFTSIQRDRVFQGIFHVVDREEAVTMHRLTNCFTFWQYDSFHAYNTYSKVDVRISWHSFRHWLSLSISRFSLRLSLYLSPLHPLSLSIPISVSLPFSVNRTRSFSFLSISLIISAFPHPALLLKCTFGYLSHPSKKLITHS